MTMAIFRSCRVLPRMVHVSSPLWTQTPMYLNGRRITIMHHSSMRFFSDSDSSKIKNGTSDIKHGSLESVNTELVFIRTNMQDLKDSFLRLDKKTDTRFADAKNDVDKRFDKVDQGFVTAKNDVDKRFDKVDQGFVDIKNDMDHGLEKIGRSIENLTEKMTKLSEDVISIKAKNEQKSEGRELMMKRIGAVTALIGALGLGAGWKSFTGMLPKIGF